MRAVGAFLADITRWYTSCCGIEPSIIVTAEPTKKAMSVNLASGRKCHRLALCVMSMTALAPPASLAENTAMTDRPMTSTIIWMKSVIATARKPPMTT